MLGTIGTYATIFGTIIGGLSLYFYLTGNPFEKNKREISFIVNPPEELLSMPKLFRDQIRIMVGDDKISHLEILSIDFKNTGDTAIIPAYYEDGITLRYRDQTGIISGYVSSGDLNFSKHDLKITETSTFIKPFIINKGDQFTIKLLCADNLNRKIDVLLKSADTEVKEVKSFPDKSFSIIAFIFEKWVSAAGVFILGLVALALFMVILIGILNKLEQLSK